MINKALNVLGGELLTCSTSPMTGFYRDGCCNTDWQDAGTHTVCARMTERFLSYTKTRGNDLITPRPEFNFPGLKPGDFWCLCVLRWKESLEAGVAPKVKLTATHAKSLEFVVMEELQNHAIDAAADA